MPYCLLQIEDLDAQLDVFFMQMFLLACPGTSVHRPPHHQLSHLSHQAEPVVTVIKFTSITLSLNLQVIYPKPIIVAVTHIDRRLRRFNCNKLPLESLIIIATSCRTKVWPVGTNSTDVNQLQT